MSWNGIVVDTTDVDETPGSSVYQVNTRMRIDGELQRRHGMIAALPQMAGPILGIAGGNGFIVSGYGTNGITSVDGSPDPVGIIIGPIVFPPIIVPQNDGGGWTVSAYASGGDGNIQATSTAPCVTAFNRSCAGSITVNHGFNHAPPGIATIIVKRVAFGGAEMMLDQRFPDGAAGQYSVTVPWSIDFPFIEVSWVGMELSINPAVSKSVAGCGGAQWYVTGAVSVTATTLVTVCPSAPSAATCPGKITLDFPTVTAPGARAVVFRDNGAGTTSIIDSRFIVSGSNYEVQIPSSTANGADLPIIRVSLNIDNGPGTIAGTITGKSAAGCA